MSISEAEMFATLDGQLDDLQSSGQAPADFVALSRELTRALQRRDWPMVEATYAQTAELAARTGDLATEALSRYGQGTSLFQLGRLAEAVPHFQHAADLAEQIGHRPLAAKAHYILAGLMLNEAEPDLAAITARQTRALTYVASDKDPSFAAQIYQARASMQALQLNLPAARADLDTALALAHRADNPQLLASLHNSYRLLDQFASAEPDLDAIFDLLDEQSQLFGFQPHPADKTLRQAITATQRQDFARALALAEAGRQEALQATDPMRYFRYLSACFIIAAAHELTENYPAVIEILLTCKGTVEKTIGPEAGEAVRAFLDALPERWGAEKFQAALETYRAQMRAKMSKQ